MKKLLLFIAIIMLVFINQAIAETINVSGNAFLEDQSDHSDIKVVFERVAPSTLLDSTYTNTFGYFSIKLETGIYNINYSKEGYYREFLNDQVLYSDKNIQDFTLSERPSFNVPSVFSSIQSAIDSTYDGDIVLVAPGTYYENINFNGKNITVASHFLTTNDTTYISNTIIDGNENGHVVEFSSGEDSTAVLIGFTITNGYATGNYPEDKGGGIYCSGTSPCLKYLIINENIADDSGGGISCIDGSPIIDDVTIMGNYAGSGGGIDCLSNIILTNVTISNNTAKYGGGGIEITGTCFPKLTNVMISENVAGRDGGGIYIFAGHLNMVNVIINNNSARNGGGIYFTSAMYETFENVILSGNTAENQGGGIYFLENGIWGGYLNLYNVNISDNSSGIYCTATELMLINCIVSNNENYGLFSNENNVSISYSNFWNNGDVNLDDYEQWIGVNVTTKANGDSCDAYKNIQLDPCFKDHESGDYHLSDDSPCIGAGIGFAEYDIEGNLRGTPPDIGAYENILDSPIYVTIVEDVPNKFYINTPYPNPFNPVTTIEYSLPEDTYIKLTIYNVSGQSVATLKDGMQKAGNYTLTWNASGMANGIYFCKIKVDGFNATKKMLLLK